MGESSALPDHRSRTAPTIVRGRLHRSYCARAVPLQQDNATWSPSKRAVALGTKPLRAWRAARQARLLHVESALARAPPLSKAAAAARAQRRRQTKGLWLQFQFFMTLKMSLGAASNGEVERPPAGASSATRAPNFFQRSRRASRRLSRTAPTIVRGRLKPAYCARAISWAQTGGTGCGDAASLSANPRAQGMRQAKGLRLQLPALHDFQGESWLRTLTVKLRGRPEAPIERRGRTLFSGARGA